VGLAEKRVAYERVEADDPHGRDDAADGRRQKPADNE
jgi:hypothetical protein